MLDSVVKERLQDGGVRVDELLERCMNNEALASRLLKKFSADTTYSKLVTACAANDSSLALEASHTLKGMCGNLSLFKLFELFSRQVELLRADNLPAATALMTEISRSYDAAVQAIQRNIP